MPLYKSSDLSVHARAPGCGARGQGRPDDPRQNRACRGRHGLTTGLRAEPGKDSQQPVQRVQPGWRLRLLRVGMSCWGPGETSPRLRTDLASKDMWPHGAGPGRCPRHRSWVGKGVCHPVLGPGKEPWVERLWELSRGGERQEGQLGGSRLLVPAQEAPVTGCSQQQTLTSLHCRSQGFASGTSYSIGEGSATPEGFGALGEPCLYPEMMRGKKKTTTQQCYHFPGEAGPAPRPAAL